MGLNSPLSAFLCSAYKNICWIFCVCSCVKEPVNTAYHCWSWWERAGERENTVISKQCTIVYNDTRVHTHTPKHNTVTLEKSPTPPTHMYMYIACTCMYLCTVGTYPLKVHYSHIYLAFNINTNVDSIWDLKHLHQIL